MDWIDMAQDRNRFGDEGRKGDSCESGNVPLYAGNFLTG
jgi:hypothetical protein